MLRPNYKLSDYHQDGQESHLRSNLMLQGSEWWRGCDFTKITVRLFSLSVTTGIYFGRWSHRVCAVIIGSVSINHIAVLILTELNDLCRQRLQAFWSNQKLSQPVGEGQIQVFNSDFILHAGELHPFTARNWWWEQMELPKQREKLAFGSFLPHV